MVGIRNLTSAIAALAFCIGVILSANEYPYGPICLYMTGMPVYLMVLYSLFLSNITNSRHYMGMLPLPLITVALSSIGLWIWWVIESERGMWNEENQLYYMEQVLTTFAIRRVARLECLPRFAEMRVELGRTLTTTPRCTHRRSNAKAMRSLRTPTPPTTRWKRF